MINYKECLKGKRGVCVFIFLIVCVVSSLAVTIIIGVQQSRRIDDLHISADRLQVVINTLIKKAVRAKKCEDDLLLLENKTAAEMEGL